MFEIPGTIILKVTRDCNLRCDYCYVRNKDSYKGEKIDFDLFKTIIQKIIIGKTLSGDKNINLVF